MHFSIKEHEERDMRIAQAAGSMASSAPPLPRASVSLMSSVPYTGSERNQGRCGNCWVWGSTGAIEIEHDLDVGILERLSIQYFNSEFNFTAGQNACKGGYPETFADFYQNSLKQVIPWSNTNAGYTDGKWNGSSAATPASIISKTPNFPVSTMTSSLIPTQKLSLSAAINNIKAEINAGKPVLWTYYLPKNGWTDFNTFWVDQPESVVWDPDPYNGKEEAGGHLVLIVGYDDTGAEPYWLVLNSWGITTGRPTGLMRLKMNMDYDGKYTYNGHEFFTHDFNILNTVFQPVPAPVVHGISPTSGVRGTDVLVSVSGSNFAPPAVVNLSRSGQRNLTAVGVDVLSPERISGSFHLPGSADLGLWNLTVRQGNLFSNDDVQFQVRPSEPSTWKNNPAHFMDRIWPWHVTGYRMR